MKGILHIRIAFITLTYLVPKTITCLGITLTLTYQENYLIKVTSTNNHDFE